MKNGIGIGERERGQLASGLTRVLADSYMLYVKTHGFHWNVSGPLFPVLHEQFEGQYKDLASAVDELAERIRMLGEFAPGSARDFAKLASIPEAHGVPAAEEMVAELLRDHEALSRAIRELCPLAEKHQDQGTIDLLSQRLRTHEKTAWMLRSQLQARKVPAVA